MESESQDQNIFHFFQESEEGGGGVFQGLNKGLYQSTNNVFHYASHTQQKLISGWGEGKFQRIILITKKSTSYS